MICLILSGMTLEHPSVWRDADISILVGKTIVAIHSEKSLDSLPDAGCREITFCLEDGVEYLMHHVQDCCEDIYLEDITGDIKDLIDSPILQAEETTSRELPGKETTTWDDSQTWTFYKFATNKGHVTLRWFGSSNGYYSERVSFVRAK